LKIELNHKIVPAQDKEQSARFYERIFGFKIQICRALGHFAPSASRPSRRASISTTAIHSSHIIMRSKSERPNSTRFSVE